MDVGTGTNLVEPNFAASVVILQWLKIRTFWIQNSVPGPSRVVLIRVSNIEKKAFKIYRNTPIITGTGNRLAF
jgi:hypothetical protein